MTLQRVEIDGRPATVGEFRPGVLKIVFDDGEVAFADTNIKKYNPYHDELGRFTTGPSAGGGAARGEPIEGVPDRFRVEQDGSKYYLVVDGERTKMWAYSRESIQSIAQREAAKPAPVDPKAKFFSANVALEMPFGAIDPADTTKTAEAWDSLFFRNNDPALYREAMESGTIQGDIKGVDIKARAETPGWSDEHGIQPVVSVISEFRGERNEELAVLRRDFTRDDENKLTVEHSIFRVADEMQGHGFAKTVLANSMDFYEKVGVRSISLQANADVGGYAWAKYGFVPTQQSWDAMRASSGKQSITANNPAYERLDAPTKVAVDKLLASPDPRSIWALADITTPTVRRGKKVTVGQDLLLASNWHGRMDLSNKEQRARFDHYISKGKK